MTALRADFGAMMGKIAKFDQKGMKVRIGNAENVAKKVPGLISRPASRLLGLKKDVVEQVADSSKWQKIFAAKPNHGLKEKLLGELSGDGVRKGGELHNMLDNLNNIFERAFIAYQKQSKI